MSCQSGTCSAGSDCYVYDQDGYTIVSNKCCDPNNNCICAGGKCVSGTCSADSDCSALGSGCKCVNGTCTCHPCTTVNDCDTASGMTCNNGVCTSKRCNSGRDCPAGTKCKNGFCVYRTPVSAKKLIILLVITVIICGAVAILYAISGKDPLGIGSYFPKR